MQSDDNDPLSAEALRARTQHLHSVAQAQAMERAAIERQAAADAALVVEQNACYARFLVTRCLDAASDARNTAWDAAHIERSAARLYVRQADAEQQRVAITNKINAFNQTQARQAPERAANARQYAQRLKEHNAKLAQARANAGTNTPVGSAAAPSTGSSLSAAQRAANVERFNAKVARIEAIKQKRIDTAARRAQEAQAKHAATAATLSPSGQK